MTIDETKMFRIHLKARALSESALVCEYTRLDSGTYPDRLARVKETLDELLKVLGIEEKANG